MEPCADHSRAAVKPRTAPAKIRNHLVPCVWKLYAEIGAIEMMSLRYDEGKS